MIPRAGEITAPRAAETLERRMTAIERSHRAASLRGSIDDLSDCARQELRRLAQRAAATVLTQRDDQPSTTAHECANAVADSASGHSDPVKNDHARRVDIRSCHAIRPPLHYAEGRSITDSKGTRQEDGAGRRGTRTFNEQHAHDLRWGNYEVEYVIDRKAVAARGSAHTNGSPRSRVRDRDGRERHRGRTARRKRNLLRFNFASVELERRARTRNCALPLSRNSRSDDRAVDAVARLT